MDPGALKKLPSYEPVRKRKMKKDIEKVEEQNIVQEEKGANLVEYALLAALIAVVCISAMSFVGDQASQTLQNVGNHLGKGASS